MTEQWRALEELPNYQVSDRGRVRRIVAACGTHAGRILKGFPDKDGYLRVTLQGERQRVRRVHQLVLGAFVGQRPADKETRHLDGDKTNNALSNLCWGTGVENYADRVKHGTGTQGSLCGTSKLTEAQVVAIRARYQPRQVTFQALADEFGVTKQCIRSVVTRKNWSHL